jgi:hypothetical protein
MIHNLTSIEQEVLDSDGEYRERIMAGIHEISFPDVLSRITLRYQKIDRIRCKRGSIFPSTLCYWSVNSRSPTSKDLNNQPQCINRRPLDRYDLFPFNHTRRELEPSQAKPSLSQAEQGRLVSRDFAHFTLRDRHCQHPVNSLHRFLRDN